MAKNVRKAYIEFQRFINGIADYEKEELIDTVAFSRNVDLRSDPRSFKLNPRTAKESGSIVTDLVKWSDRVGDNTYMIGNAGNLYKRDTNASYSLLRSISNNNGNGMAYYGEDNYLYYPSDKVIGRYGPLDNNLQSAVFTDDFLGSEGGAPLNTHSLHLVAASSQYAYRADSATLSPTGDIAIEMYIKPESLPTDNGEMILMSKWNENGNKRSFKFGIHAVSNYFGDGSDGALTISSNTTEAPIDSACTGTLNSTSLSATNASFAAGQKVLIHQTQGTGAGTYQINTISSYTAGTITLADALNATYSTGAQVRVLKQYTNVTVNSGITYTAKAWNGTVGGILAFLANGTVTITGTITASGKGFRGGIGYHTGSVGGSPAGAYGYSGEGSGGASARNSSTAANGNGAGSSYISSGNDLYGTAGSGGSNSTGATTGDTYGTSGVAGAIGSTLGSSDLSTMAFGGGGGGGASQNNVTNTTAGGNGGGIIFISGTTVNVTGSVVSLGLQGGDPTGDENWFLGGGGAGGSVLIKAQTASLGSSLITATGGRGGQKNVVNTWNSRCNGGSGGTGRIAISYYTSYTGSTSPTLNATQDNTLGAADGYELRLAISNDGTAVEYYTKTADILEDAWQRVAVSWEAAASTADFMLNDVSLGTSTGAMTAINNNDSQFIIGASLSGAGAAENFYDGFIDEARLWDQPMTVDTLRAGSGSYISANSVGLLVWYKLNNSLVDATANAQDLTGSGTPTYSTNVPYSAPTSRLDLDQSLDTSGQTYTTPTSIDEASNANRQDFIPAKDPQKSIEVNIGAVGTGNWTLTVHDQLNRVVATKTVVVADLHTGDFEFVFSSVWTPIIGATYHFHITSTVNDGTVVTTTASNLNTADFHSYYQFLVEDTEWHPAVHFSNFLAIANGRYLATWDASTYDPHRLTLPPGYRIRALAKWNEYLAIGTMRGTNIYDYEEGMIFFWNGIDKTYNYPLYVPEGGINALFGARSTLHIFAGYQGEHIEYKGGSDSEKVKQVPKIENDKYIEIYPGAVTMWKRLFHYGVAGGGDSDDVQRGVYSWGKKNGQYNDALVFDYVISTDNYLSSVKIGMVYPVGKKLLISWQDNVSYGVDVVDPAAAPFAEGTVEFPIKDYNHVWKEKDVATVRADFLPLLTGHDVRVKYKLDLEDDWNTMGAAEIAKIVVGAEKSRLSIKGGRHKQIQLACDISTSVSTSPRVFCVAAEHSPLSEEEAF